MGQKNSKKVNLYATENTTHCHLLPDDVSKYVGRAREYTAVDVYVEEPGIQIENDDKKEDGKKKSPKRHPNSILKLLTRAHRKSYHLAFIIPKVEGGKSSRLGRNSFIKEENESESNDASGKEANQFSHTVFLLRPKVKSRLKKEFSLKRMEAKKTFLNIMMDVGYGWVFTTKDFVENVSKIPSGDYVKEVHKMVSEQASKGGRLLTVMRVDDTPILKQTTATENKQENRKLHLRMVFLHRNTENPKPVFEYNVKCIGIQCTEQTLKPNKKQNPGRDVNVTWSTDWMALFQSQTRLTEVINVGELPTGEAPNPDKKGKKIKIRSFEVMTLCFYETFLPQNNKEKKNEEDDDVTDVFHDVAAEYEGLVREVWSPIDETVQENLGYEAEKYGEHGWELSTVLVTSHVRNSVENQKQLRKCAIFFQRPLEKYVSQDEREKSRENLLESELGKIAIEESHPPQTELLDDSNIPPTSPKEKIEKYGRAMLPQVDLSQAKKLKSASPKKEAAKPQDVPVIAKVQLKKINRDEIKKEATPQLDTSAMSQVKLRPTETNKPSQQKKDSDKESVPWLATLEKKKEAVLKAEPKTPEMKKANKANDEITRKFDEMQEKRNKKQTKEQKEATPPVVPITDNKPETLQEEIQTITTENENIADLPSPPSSATIKAIETVEIPPEEPTKEIELVTETPEHATLSHVISPIIFDFTEIEQQLEMSNTPIDETTDDKEVVLEDSQAPGSTDQGVTTSLEESIETELKVPETCNEMPNNPENTATTSSDRTVENTSDEQAAEPSLDSDIALPSTDDIIELPNAIEQDDDAISKSNDETTKEDSRSLNEDLPSPPPTLTHSPQETFTSTLSTVLLSPKENNPEPDLPAPIQSTPVENESPEIDVGLPLPTVDFPAPIVGLEANSTLPDQQKDLPPPIIQSEDFSDPINQSEDLPPPINQSEDVPPPITQSEDLLDPVVQSEEDLSPLIIAPEDLPPPIVASQEDLPPLTDQSEEDLPLPISETEENVPLITDSPQPTATPCGQQHAETPDVVTNGPVENQPEEHTSEAATPVEEIPLHDQEPLSVLFLPSPPPITDDFFQESPEVEVPPSMEEQVAGNSVEKEES